MPPLLEAGVAQGEEALQDPPGDERVDDAGHTSTA